MMPMRKVQGSIAIGHGAEATGYAVHFYWYRQQGSMEIILVHLVIQILLMVQH